MEADGVLVSVTTESGVMEQLSKEVMTSEVDAERTLLPTPRFDARATRMARPVVPLSYKNLFLDYTTTLRSQLKNLLSGRGSRLLAVFVALVLVAGAMALGVTAHRRNRVTPTQSLALAPASDATGLEVDQHPVPDQSLSFSAPAAPR